MKFILTFIVTIMALPAMAQKDTSLKISEIAEGVYLHTSFKNIEGYGLVDSNGLIVVDANQAYIIDTPWSEDDTETLLTWIADNGYQAKASISTHSHADRTAGIKLLNSRLIQTYTSELTKELLVQGGKPIPTHTFNGSEFSLGNGLVELYYPGAGHTEDNIIAWLPKSKILFGGCIVRSHEWESLGYVGDASIISWADSIENIKAKNYDINMVVPGHGTVGQADILDHTIDLAKSAVTN
ncbi:DIM/SIM/IMP family subclass B1 metallo-beta-lactamase [Thalassotalea ponticola]|uniref:DIM/SIM/IMP family subclass B1 metallo-beta-lactamase n=1 Tax=Thalassotalea ponticola TaxID=1523392 RepID=UPI0025B4E5BD|nr:DIM/SIM/IMP family subclass B1 metallo-beta-lactamase [Thalassotalea ponticola]MDN3652276.1 DIM/SIM/IMP family subclass B1 metallo-beta-lactamase [Thalassotalea ponticola]